MRLVLTRVGVLQARAHRCHSSFLGMQPSCRGRTRAIGRRWQQGSHGCPSCRLPQIHGLRMRARPELLSLAWARCARVDARGRRSARMRIALGRAARACTRVGAFGHHAPRAKRVCACPLSWPARGSICRSWSFVVGRAAMMHGHARQHMHEQQRACMRDTYACIMRDIASMSCTAYTYVACRRVDRS